MAMAVSRLSHVARMASVSFPVRERRRANFNDSDASPDLVHGLGHETLRCGTVRAQEKLVARPDAAAVHLIEKDDDLPMQVKQVDISQRRVEECALLLSLLALRQARVVPPHTLNVLAFAQHLLQLVELRAGRVRVAWVFPSVRYH